MITVSLNIKKFITIVFVLTLQLGDFMLNVSGRQLALNNVLYIIIITAAICYLFSNKLSLSSEDCYLIFYWTYALIMTLIWDAIVGLDFPIEYIYHLLYMVLVLIVVRKSLFSNRLFWKLLYFMSLLQCVTLAYQEITRLKIGEFVKFISYAQEDRPAALFSEPAHFCMLICFALCCVLFHIDTLQISDRARFIVAIIFSVSAIASVSSAGLVYVAYIWGAWFLIEKKLSGKKIFMIVLLASTLTILLTRTDWLLRAFNHLTETNFRRSTSGSVRIMRCFDLYSRIPVINKFIGYGAGNIPGVIRKTGFISIYDHIGNYHNVYVSAFSSIFLETGILGLILFLLYAYKLEKNGNITMRVLGILFFLYILVNEVIYTPQIFILLFIICIEKDSKNSLNLNYNTELPT